jgi:hypothetical protein
MPRTFWSQVVGSEGQNFSHGLGRCHLPRINTAAPGTRAVYRAYFPFRYRGKLRSFRSFVIQGVDGGETNWWTTLQNLKVRMVLQTSKGFGYDTSASWDGFPGSVTPFGMSSGITWGAAETAGSSATGSARKTFVFNADEPGLISVGDYWVQCLFQVLYSGEPRPSLAGDVSNPLSQHQRRLGDGQNTVPGIAEYAALPTGGIDSTPWLENRVLANVGATWNNASLGTFDSAPAFTGVQGILNLRIGLR